MTGEREHMQDGGGVVKLHPVRFKASIDTAAHVALEDCTVDVARLHGMDPVQLKVRLAEFTPVSGRSRAYRVSWEAENRALFPRAVMVVFPYAPQAADSSHGFLQHQGMLVEAEATAWRRWAARERERSVVTADRTLRLQEWHGLENRFGPLPRFVPLLEDGTDTRTERRLPSFLRPNLRGASLFARPIPSSWRVEVVRAFLEEAEQVLDRDLFEGAAAYMNRPSDEERDRHLIFDGMTLVPTGWWRFHRVFWNHYRDRPDEAPRKVSLLERVRRRFGGR